MSPCRVEGRISLPSFAKARHSVYAGQVNPRKTMVLGLWSLGLRSRHGLRLSQVCEFCRSIHFFNDFQGRCKRWTDEHLETAGVLSLVYGKVCMKHTRLRDVQFDASSLKSGDKRRMPPRSANCCCKMRGMKSVPH